MVRKDVSSLEGTKKKKKKYYNLRINHNPLLIILWIPRPCNNLHYIFRLNKFITGMSLTLLIFGMCLSSVFAELNGGSDSIKRFTLVKSFSRIFVTLYKYKFSTCDSLRLSLILAWNKSRQNNKKCAP